MRHPTDQRVHFSELKCLNESAAHYAHACLTAKTVTRPMTVGSVADCMVFGNRGYAVYPGKVRNGREWEAFRAEHKGEIICIQSELEDAMGAAQAVRNDAAARAELEDCDYQLQAQWEMYGLPCSAGIKGERGGFDAYSKRRKHMVDLKITSTVKPDELMRHAFRMFWHCQAAWYVDGARAAGMPCDTFALICASANAPHLVTVLELGEDVLQMGRKMIRLWVEKLKSCEATDEWPGYVQTRIPLSPPEWMLEEEP
jgi:hypothetical protein